MGRGVIDEKGHTCPRDKEVRSDAHPFSLRELFPLIPPANFTRCSFNRFYMTAAPYYKLTRGDVPCLKTVFLPYLQGIKAKLFCYHIEHRFYDKSGLERSMPPLSPTIGFIGIGPLSIIFEVWNHIRPILKTAMEINGNRPKAVVGPSVCNESGVYSHDLSILLYPYPLIHNSRMAP